MRGGGRGKGEGGERGREGEGVGGVPGELRIDRLAFVFSVAINTRVVVAIAANHILNILIDQLKAHDWLLKLGA